MNWSVVKSCIVSAAERTVGRGKRKQPEWFEENIDELVPLIEAKNVAHTTMLNARTVASRKAFRRHQSKL